MTGRSSYKPTFFDREGPAGVLRIHAAKYGAVTFGLGLVMFATLGSQKLGLGGWQLILFTLVGAFTLSAGGVWVGFKLGDVPVPVRYFREASSINFLRSTRYGVSTLVTIAQFWTQRFGARLAMFQGSAAQPE